MVYDFGWEFGGGPDRTFAGFVADSSNLRLDRIRTGDLCRVRATFRPGKRLLTKLNYRPKQAQPFNAPFNLSY
jgi:hypothetical protein